MYMDLLRIRAYFTLHIRIRMLIAGTAPEKGGPKDCLKYDITTLLPPFQGEEVRFGHFV